MNYGKYTHIKEYISVFKNNLKALEEGSLTTEEGTLYLVDLNNLRYENEICKRLELFKKELEEGWLEHSKGLTMENFYEYNNRNLEELNNYVKSEIEANKLKKLNV